MCWHVMQTTPPFHLWRSRSSIKPESSASPHHSTLALLQPRVIWQRGQPVQNRGASVDRSRKLLPPNGQHLCRFVLVCLLDQGSKELLFFVFQKCLLLCRSAWPIPQRIAGRFELKLESSQVEIEACDDFLSHGAEATSRIITDSLICLTQGSIWVPLTKVLSSCETLSVWVFPSLNEKQFRDGSGVAIIRN